MRPIRRMALFLLPQLLLVQPFAVAETIELVTYYPSTGTGDLHVRSITVGTDYENENPGDGEALIVGPVGIGTVNPQAMLDIYAEDEAYLRVSGTGINADPENFSGLELGSDLPAGGGIDRVWQLAHKRGGAGAVNDLHLNYFDGAAWSTRLAVEPSGFVGIGIANPASLLHLRNTDTQPTLFVEHANTVSHSAAYFTSSNPATWITFQDGGTTQPVHVGTMGNDFWVQTGGSGRFKVQADGKVGIGTANPTSTLEVTGTMEVLGASVNLTVGTVYQASTDGFVVFSGVPVGTTQYFVNCYVESTNPPTAIRARTMGYSIGGNYESIPYLMVPVRKGEYYKVQTENTGTVINYQFVPMGQ